MFNFFTDRGDIPNTSLPNDSATVFGGALRSAAALMAMDGNIYRNVLTTAINPASTNADIVVDAYQLPAGSLDKVGRGLEITAMGNVANNTNSKRIKLWWNPTNPTIGQAISGGTLVADTGAYVTAAAVGYSLTAMIFKGSSINTQLCLHQAAQIGAQVGALVTSTVATAVESGAIWIAVTANAATTATDISHVFTEVFAMN